MISFAGLLDSPTTWLWASMVFPVLARFFVAWTVWLRVRGWVGGANIEPKRQRADYPKPNDPVWEGVVLIGGVAAASLVAAILSPLMLGGIPSWVWPCVYAGAAIGSLAYAFRRIRADDSRQRQRLAERLTSDSTSDRAL